MWSVRLHYSPFNLIMNKSSISQSVKHTGERRCCLSDFFQGSHSVGNRLLEFYAIYWGDDISLA
jgi:hypothetical protein